MDCTELHFAILSRRHDVVQEFINAGSDPTVQLHNGMTSVQCAKIMHQSEIVRVLESASANIGMYQYVFYLNICITNIHTQ